MKHSIKFILSIIETVSIAGLMSLTGCKSGNKVAENADTLVLGNIITVDNERLFAKAMTIKDGYIQYVGSKENAMKFCDAKTKVLDYGTSSVYPGFMEGHCHGGGAGQLASTIKLNDAFSYEEYQKIIADYIQKHPDEKMYKISGWRVLGVPPTKQLLDEICPEKPVFGNALDGHSMLLNTKAFELLKLDDEFIKEFGEMVQMGEDGKPTGFVTEGAASKLMKALPVDIESAKKFLLTWQDFAIRNGYVAACEAGVNLLNTAHEAYAELAKEGALKLRTRAYYCVQPNEANEQTVEEISRMSKEFNDEYYKIVGLKLFVDGVVESHTALLCDGYADDPDNKGMNRFPDSESLKALVLSAHRHGLPTHTHTIGDGAVKYMLDAIEYAKNTTGDNSIRDMLAHIELVKPEDIDRFAKYNVSALVSALWAPKNAITPFEQEVSLLGEERSVVPYQVINSFVKMGVNCAQHTDYPVSTAINVPLSIYCAVTRCLPGGDARNTRNPDEAINRLEALRELTINVAYLWNEEDHMGTLTPGKVANYVVYDRDFIHDDIESIPDAKLLHVVIDGEEAYSNAQ